MKDLAISRTRSDLDMLPGGNHVSNKVAVITSPSIQINGPLTNA